MESSSSTPLASSHASSIVRAALRMSIPSPATPSPAHRAGAYNISSPNSAWDEAITSPAAPRKYHLYGLANSESSVAEDQEEPPSKHAEPIPSKRVEPIALLTKPAQKTEELDLFGPGQPQLSASAGSHKRRHADAVLTEHVKRIRTMEWVQEICRDITRGLEDGEN
ncbi:hypothetical protein B0H13DRAFT_2056896 [Mycena leptocephala]|nr:hypothetical protein B0H13DRAFT_2056896 [Mycena leptocephala]